MVGDNPGWIHSQAAFAKLAGVCPVPASSGKTNRHRLNRGGHRQLNSGLYRGVIVRMASTSPPSTTWPDARAKARRKERSSAASSGISHARSTRWSGIQPDPSQRLDEL
ncbi:transposase [Streptomyces canus]|uniref:transposase n=1 Tax=Streptomyces canus TaxID=58343 RepID=UPI003592EA64